MKIYKVSYENRVLSSENNKEAFYNSFIEYEPKAEKYFNKFEEAKKFYDSIKIGETKKFKMQIETIFAAEGKMIQQTDADDDYDTVTLEDLYNTGLYEDVIFFDCSDPYQDEDEDDDDEQN